MAPTKLFTTSVLLLAASAVEGFVVTQQQQRIASSSTTALQEATGGWGIGQSREISENEYAKSDRRAFEGYELTDRGDFMRNVKEESDMMKKAELDELMGVASFAKINVKDPKERLNRFDADVFAEDDDDLDLSV